MVEGLASLVRHMMNKNILKGVQVEKKKEVLV